MCASLHLEWSYKYNWTEFSDCPKTGKRKFLFYFYHHICKNTSICLMIKQKSSMRLIINAINFYIAFIDHALCTDIRQSK